MKIKQTITVMSLTLLFVMAAAGLAFTEIAVIVNPHNSASDISGKDLKNIYKLKKTTWPDGSRIEAINLKKTDPLRENFSKAVLKKSASAIERFYLKQALSGKGQPPKVLNSSSDVKKLVESDKNAIGYIDANDVDDSVKVLSIDGKKGID